MTRDQVLEKVRAMVVDQLGCEEEEVTEEASFVEDLGADSLDLCELAMAAEEEFEFEIPDEDLALLKTVGEAVDYINRQLA